MSRQALVPRELERLARQLLTACRNRNLSTTMGHSTGLIREQFPVWRGKWWED